MLLGELEYHRLQVVGVRIQWLSFAVGNDKQVICCTVDAINYGVSV